MTERKATERERAVGMTKTERAIIAAAYSWENDRALPAIGRCKCVHCELTRTVRADRKAKKRGKRA